MVKDAIEELEIIEKLYDCDTIIYFRNIANFYINYLNNKSNSRTGIISNLLTGFWYKTVTTNSFETDFPNFLLTLTPDDFFHPPTVCFHP